MKAIASILRRLAKGLLLLTLPVLAADTNRNPQLDSPSRDAGLEQAVLDEAKTEVQARVEMSAPMEAEIEAGVDPVVEAVRLGVIIDASLSDVETALASAAASPDPEDDLRALDLKHRGSYRFYCDVEITQPGDVTGE